MKIKLALLSTVFLAQTTFAESFNFQAACEKGDSVTVGGVGDFLMHEPFQRHAEFRSSFSPLWKSWLPYTQSADIMYGNLETPTAPGMDRSGRIVENGAGRLRFDNIVYTSYPTFNVHTQILKDIKDSGFDIVSTANNHALDRGDLGLEKTIIELKSAGLNYVGTRLKSENFDTESYRVIEKNGIKTAWIACTAVYNSADKNNLMLGCEKNGEYIYALIKSLSAKYDAVIVTPHWGDEMAGVNDFQRRFAKNVINAGALAIIGAHPHVLQPVEKMTTPDGRDAIVAYSMGNFLGFHPHILQKTTMMIFINFVKTAGVTKIRDVQFMPGLIRNRTGDYKDVQVLPIDKSGQYIGEKELRIEMGQNFGAQAIKRITSLVPVEHVVEHGKTLDFTRMCSK